MRVGPTGKLTLEDTKTSVNALSPEICDRERAYLASIDNDKFLREIIDDANRGNSSFYMIDPGGLKVRGADRSGAMRTLAENTDGLAVLNTNDLDKGLNRIFDDMSSYYLLGYYASNTKPDGRFRTISVRVKQPGVEVRARKGYRAPGADDIKATAAIKATLRPSAATPVQAALDRLSRIRPTARFRVDAVAGPGPMRSVWVVGSCARRHRGPTSSRKGRRRRSRRLPAPPRRRQRSRSSRGSACSWPGWMCRRVRPAALDIRVRLSQPDDSACSAVVGRRSAGPHRDGTEARHVPPRPDDGPAARGRQPTRCSAEPNGSGSSSR